MATDTADDEYMTMDADKWSYDDDTYENGDTLDLDLRDEKDSREQKREELTKEKVATKRPLQNTQTQTLNGFLSTL